MEKEISGFDVLLRFRIESRSFSHPELVFHQQLTYNVFSTGDMVIDHISMRILIRRTFMQGLVPDLISSENGIPGEA
jgi:hypothetical protein